MQARTPDELWRRLKQWAEGAATSGDALPTHEECMREAARLANEVLGAGLPGRAIEFYGTEACAMIDHLRKHPELRDYPVTSGVDRTPP